MKRAVILVAGPLALLLTLLVPIRREPALDDSDHVVPRQRLTLSLTFDHRVVDGAPAARVLQTPVSAVENPGAWLIG